ncbi:Hypp5510 [Branchiostoma lanceolatum]|uniref:Hypp5510 protein n=1 Tax=Branchiostoma lanceolatum TaxID=7740 RepID=A0A8J9VXD0_BRALA|nr:Hypp5510 [Branchiostoma lanceolatum]
MSKGVEDPDSDETTPLITSLSGAESGSEAIQNLKRNTQTYKGQKTIHETVQNTALLTSNVAQLVTLIKENPQISDLTTMQVARIALLGASVLFQLIVYVLLLLQGKTFVKKEHEYARPEQRQEDRHRLKKKNKVAIVFSVLVMGANFALTQLN